MVTRRRRRRRRRRRCRVKENSFSTQLCVGFFSSTTLAIRLNKTT
jgi:hypothetical protein